MNEKPGKRLVSKKEYVRVVAKASILPLLSLSVWWGCFSIFRDRFPDCLLYRAFWENFEAFPNAHYVVYGISVTLLGMSLWHAVRKARAGVASALSRVTPITRYNTGDLPAVETLVRASDLPHSRQQAELLRGAMPGSTTVPEELLRASVTNGSGADRA